MTERKPLHERVKERLEKSQTYQGQKELKARDARSNLLEWVKALQGPGQTPESSSETTPTPQQPQNQPQPPVNQDGSQTNAPTQPQSQPDRTNQEPSQSFERFSELIESNEKYNLVVTAVQVIIGLLKNHRHERNVDTNLIKYFGLNADNLNQILTAILTSIPDTKVTRNDITAFTTGETGTISILFSNVFSLNKNRHYEEGELKSALERLCNAAEPFQEFIGFISEYGDELMDILYEIHQAENRPSAYGQIQIAVDADVPNALSAKIYDRNPISAALNQAQATQPQPETAQPPVTPPPTNPPATPPAAPAPAQPSVANEANEAGEANEAFDYLNDLFILFQQATPSNELINDLNNFQTDASMGTALLASQSEPGTVDIKQIIEDQFETTDETEINQIAIELYNKLKGEYPLKSDQQISLA